MSLMDDYRQQQLQAQVQQRSKNMGHVSNFNMFDGNMTDQGAYDELDAGDKWKLQHLADNYDPDTQGAEVQALYKKGAEAAQYKMTNNPIVQNPDGTVGLRKELMLQGADKYTAPLLAQQNTEEKFGRDDAVLKAQQAADQSRANMSMRGGMKSGNNMLQDRQSLKDMLMAQQGVSQQAMKSRADINAKGADVQLQNDRTNNQNLLTGIDKTNQFNLEKYKQKMNVQASNTQADATRAAGGGGSWVCTEVHKRNPLTKKEAFALFKLRKYALKNVPRLAQFYLYDCADLVTKMKEKGADWSENTDFVKNTVALVDQGAVESAFEYYVSYIFEKMNKFWPECNHPVFVELKGDFA